MSANLTLTNFLQRCAEAIRCKCGDTEKICGADIPTRIENLMLPPEYPIGQYVVEYGKRSNNTEGPLHIKVFGKSFNSEMGSCHTVEYAEGITEIAASAGGGSNSVNKVVLPSTLTSFGEQAFNSCDYLNQLYNHKGEQIIPEGVTVIPFKCFNVTSLTELKLHDGITEIGSNAFNSTALYLIDLPASLDVLGKWAFYYNEGGITELNFKRKPTTLDSSALASMNALATIRVPWSEGEVAGAPWGASNATIIYNYVPGTDVHFSINGVTYGASQGATWKEWVNSSHNVDGFVLMNGFVYNAAKLIAVKKGAASVTENSPVEANVKYTLS